jgi:hypothetical protein
MMDLQTVVNIEKDDIDVSHADSLLLIGSCFTDNIGDRLETAAFDVRRNPFGILYNPLSIAQCLQRCLADRELTNDDLVFQQGQWHSWLHHSSFSQSSPQECLKLCNYSIHDTHAYLQSCTTLVITFGTAYVYHLKSDGRVVGNCHKVPQQQFMKQLSTVDDIVREWQNILFSLPRNVKKIIFTVSPIRHWADGAHGNQLSKAILLLAIDRLVGHRSGHTIGYFPAYELMMDELRDYRFYADDLLHPSTLATEIIWQRFATAYMNVTTQQTAHKAEQLYRMQQHRPFFPDSEEYRQHQAKTQQLQQELQMLMEQEQK